jgi:MFS family permease
MTLQLDTPARPAHRSIRAHAPALALAAASFPAQLDITATIAVMPSIGGDLDLGLTGMAWVMDAYSLALTGLLLAAGALADRHGRRRALLAGNALFALASLACGFAWSGPALWAGRALQGAAAAFIFTGTIALIAGAYPRPDQRARAFALVGVVTGSAMALGPTLGAVAAASLGWRSIFLLNLPVCALMVWLIPRVVAESRDPGGRPLDLPGVALLTAALGIAIETLLQARGAPVVQTLGMLASAGLIAAFVAQQRRQARPMLDPDLFLQPAMIGLAVVLLAVSVSYWAVLVYLPLFMQTRFALPPELASLALLVATLPMLVLPPAGGAVAARWGWRKLFAIGLGLLPAGDLVLAFAATADRPTALHAALLGMAVIGAGVGLVQAQLSGAVVALAPPAQAGMASAITVVLRQAGFAIGIAALGGMLGADASADGFAAAFMLAAAAAVGGIAAVALLPSRPR